MLSVTFIVSALLSLVLILSARSDVTAISGEHLSGLEESGAAYFDQATSTMIEQLAKNLINPIYYTEFDYMQQLLSSAKGELIVDSVILLDEKGKILHEGDSDFPRLGMDVGISTDELQAIRKGELLMRVEDNRRTALKGVLLGDELLGIVLVESRPYVMFQQIRQIYDQLETRTQRMIFVYSLSAAMVTLVMMVLAGVLSWIMAERLTRPIRILQAQAEQMGSGDLQIADRIEREDELGDLAKSIYTMAADLELQNRSVKYLAFHDPLTGIANRAAFQMDLEDQIVKAAGGNQSCALMFVDIDDFKTINDASGHDRGDRALKTLADRISDGVHDFFETGEEQPSIARIGGDEFTVIIPGGKAQKTLREIAERILEVTAQPVAVEGDMHQLSASIGIACYPRDGDSTSTLLNAADKAMYNSKLAGRGTYRFFEAEMSNEDHQSLKIKADFKQALGEPGELQLLYQPIVHIETGEIYGGEALIRWEHPKMGALEPGQFISIVENNEIALAADLWVIESTLDLLESMNLSNKPNFVISANISASNLGREQFPEAVARLLKQSPVNPKHLQLEITETYLHRDEGKALQSLNSLKALGVKLWLDDFCTGYSSLKHLHMFPANGIKIDRQFVINLNKRTEDRLLVSAMVSLAASFNIGIVAEGIDNQADRELLLALDCELGQGELFSKPLPSEIFIRYVRDGILLPT